jgi:DnaJ-class molecular chaperone
MRLEEMLKTNEAKHMYRELSKKFHPDSKTGNIHTMVKINNAKDKGDAYLKKIYYELMKKKEKKKSLDVYKKLEEVEKEINNKFKKSNIEITIRIIPKRFPDKINADVTTFVKKFKNIEDSTFNFTVFDIDEKSFGKLYKHVVDKIYARVM